MSNESYVYEGTEVILTGRVAKKQLMSKSGTIAKTFELKEIKPKDTSVDWLKWVDPSQLYKVE